MARVDDLKPDSPPSISDTGPVPHFPTGTPEPLKNPPPQPNIGDNKEVPGDDYPPARSPFPDHTPDPGVDAEP